MAAGNNPEIEVTVSWSGSKWVFTDASDVKGNLLIDKRGNTPIRFKRDPAQAGDWAFITPWVRFGEFSIPPVKDKDMIPSVLNRIGNPTVAEIRINDNNNQGLNSAAFYFYSLFTDNTDAGNNGEIDPMIVNGGGT